MRLRLHPRKRLRHPIRPRGHRRRPTRRHPPRNTLLLGAEAEQDRVKVKVFGSSDAPRSIICAAYDSGGIMLDVIFDTLPALDGTADITIPITLKNAAAFNIMIWDGGDSIKPLCENFILENNY